MDSKDLRDEIDEGIIMNIIQDIEGVTLATIGAFCAAAVTSIVLHSANVLPTEQVAAAAHVVELPPVVIVGKRLSAVEKTHDMQAPIAG
jgi:hypothetical protein